MQDTDFTTLTIHEIYRLRNWAGKVDNQDILSRIKAHLNARVGANGTYPFTQAETTLEEVLSQTPPEAWLIVDHQIVNTQETERYCHKFQKEVFDKFGERIKVSMCSGELPEEFHRDKHVVLLATRNGFCVLKARGTSTSGKVLVLGDEMKETGMTRGELNIIGKPTPQSKSRFFDEPAEWEAKEANTKEYVRLDRLMSIPESTTVLIQMTYQMDDANDRRVTRQVQQLVSDTLRAGLKPVITIASLGSDQKDKMDLYLTNAVVLDVYPGCIIVSKARGDMGLKEVGKKVLLGKREDMDKTMPKYMFKNIDLLGSECYHLQSQTVNGKLKAEVQLVDSSSAKVFKLIDEKTGDYCFVFSDEAALFSKPYPDVSSAIKGFKEYCKLL